MNEFMKSRFRRIEVDEMDYKQKIRVHRLRIAKLIAIIILVVALAILGIYLFFRFREYDSYKVLDSQKVETISEADYYTFSGGVLKVSRNGAIFSDVSGKQIWNQTYEMNQPTVDICGNYVAIGNVKGNEVYILNKTELLGQIRTEDPIRAVEVSEKGTVAALTDGESSYKIVVYDKKNELLAQGEFHLENSGYPMAITMSADGMKLGVSFVNIEGGRTSTRIHFYNFGSVGQNEIDNQVSAFTYEGVVIPQIEYLDKNIMAAYGTNQIILFSGEEKPNQHISLPVNEEIKTIFYSDTLIGLTYDVQTEDKKTVHEVLVYDLSGREVLREQFSTKYESVKIMSDEEIAILRGNHCTIYTLDGVKKFCGEMKQNILNISKTNAAREYKLLLSDEVIRIRLE